MKKMAFEDPSDPGNSSAYHTGNPCWEDGCENPAGTAWSPYFCFPHNIERIRRISKQLEELVEMRKTKRKKKMSDKPELIPPWASPTEKGIFCTCCKQTFADVPAFEAHLSLEAKDATNSIK